MVRGAIGDDDNLVAFVLHDLRFGNQGARGLELAVQPVQVVLIIVGTLAVLSLLIVTAAARKPRRRGVSGSGQCPVADAVAVHIFVARKSTQAVEVFLRQDLASV